MKFSPLIHCALLATIPSMAFPANPPIVSVHETTPWQLDLNYDDVIKLIEDIESGALEHRCSPADLDRINAFIAQLATQGVLPDEPEEAQAIEDDIQELLEDANPYSFSYSLGDECVIIPAIYRGNRETLLCKSWLEKKWHKTKKFVKEHKTAVLVGVAVVVAAVAVVGIVAAVSAGTAAAAAGSSGKSSPAPRDPIPTNDVVAASSEVVTECISSFKETLAKEHLLSAGEFPLKENGRVIGSLFAHDSLQTVSRQNPFLIAAFGHSMIDQKFSTDYASWYKDFKEPDFNTLSYQLRGEKALSYGYLNQAVNDLSKAIELDPTSPMAYLERGIAHLGLGEYERSLEDYKQFAAQQPPSRSLVHFTKGFAKGLPKGIYKSGEGMVLLVSDIVKHPVHTGQQVWEALVILSELACTDQWSAFAEALAPEVHYLITHWHTLSSEEQGEQSGYIFGKYGADILTPAACAKACAALKGLKGAEEIAAIAKNLKAAEKALVLESVAALETPTQIGEFIQASRTTLALAEEAGLTVEEMRHLKQAGQLEEVVANTANGVFKDPKLSESYHLIKNAENVLQPYIKKFMPENEVRKLIQDAGIRTFPRPEGIPKNYLVRITENGAGMEYSHPSNTHISIRIMPGKPHSPNPCQQKPYVIYKKNGKAYDKYGNLVNQNAPEAHIPIEEFVYRD